MPKIFTCRSVGIVPLQRFAPIAAFWSNFPGTNDTTVAYSTNIPRVSNEQLGQETAGSPKPEDHAGLYRFHLYSMPTYFNMVTLTYVPILSWGEPTITDWIQATVAFLLLLSTIVQIGLLVRSNNTAIKAVDLANSNLRIYMDGEGGRLGIARIDRMHNSGDPTGFKVGWSIVNRGRTDCTILESSAFLFVYGGAVPVIPEEYTLPLNLLGPFNLPPGEETGSNKKTLFDPPVQAWSDMALSKGEQSLLFRGYVRYMDQFGRIRRLNFGWRYQLYNRAFSPEGLAGYNSDTSEL